MTETILPNAKQATAIDQQQRAAEPRLGSPESDSYPMIHLPRIVTRPQVSCSRAIDPSKPTSFRNTIQISRSDMEKYFNCPQRLAAQKLGVSMSTLKRRFYQLKMGRWPCQLTQDRRRRSVWHLVNEVEPKSEKELCPNTVQTLTRLFSMNLQEQQLLATQNLSSQRNLSSNGSEPPPLKFMRYVPSSETLTKPVTNTNGVRKKHRRFLRLDAGTSDGSRKGDANGTRQTILELPRSVHFLKKA